ncbi:MAG: aldehyde dehydrogenase family protein [Gemmatimonadaceae bacterium]
MDSAQRRCTVRRDHPYTQDAARVTDCGAADANDAVEAAVAAFTLWRQTSAYERSTLLRRLDAILVHQDELAQLAWRWRWASLSRNRAAK